MQLHPLDWFFIIGYGVLALGVSIFFTKQASQNMEEFFVAGRKLSWWLAGTSIVATTFAVDTPLAVSGFIRSGGIYTNWLWWCVCMGGMLCVFFFAKMWRRAEILTDVEFIELRYDGRSASFLRGFMAIYKGVLYNCVTMGWVILAMTKVLGVVLQWDKLTSLTVLILFALIYTLLSGFWGVVLTDFVQFIMAMIGSFALAGIVLWDLGGPSGMIDKVTKAPGFQPKMLHFVPDFNAAGEMALFTFIVLLTVKWWSYGEGSGYITQRLFSTKSEKDSLLAVLWFNFAHYVLRPWPWIVVGIASVVYFPLQKGQDPELFYPKMMMKFLPIGLKGLMVASLFAAFMSTIDTHLNWGASYLVNDIYKRFLVPEKQASHYVTISRIVMVLLAIGGALFAWQMDTIKGAWIYLAILMSGASLVGLLRWFWWRINAWSEISAMLASFILTNLWLLVKLCKRVGLYLPPSWEKSLSVFYGKEYWAVRLLVILGCSTLVWLLVTFLTQPTSKATLEAFYDRVRPHGWWKAAIPTHTFSFVFFRRNLLAWLLGVTAIYSALFGCGYLLIAKYLFGSILLVVSLIAGSVLLVFFVSEQPKES